MKTLIFTGAEKEDSDFTRYKSGYVDGYEGDEIKLPKDKVYLRGYWEGNTDDSLGEPNKFSDVSK